MAMSARSILLLAVLVAFCAELPLSNGADYVKSPDATTTFVLPASEKSVKLRWEWSLSGREETNQAEIKRYKSLDQANTQKQVAVLYGRTGQASTPETDYFIAAGNLGTAGSINGYLELTIKDVFKQGNNQNGVEVDVMAANYTYVCAVTVINAIKVLADKVTELNVFEKPTITRAPEDKDVTNLNTEMTLTCVARGKLAPTIIWSRLDMQGTTQEITTDLDNQVNGLQTTNKYTKKNFQASDVGIYTCKASNGVGSTSADAIVQYTTCESDCATDDQIAIEITNLTYTRVYENVNSNEYIGLKKTIEKESLALYARATQKVYSCVVTGFRSGSVIANIKITYKSGTDKPRQPLLDAIKTGTFAGYPVRKEFVSPTSASPLTFSLSYVVQSPTQATQPSNKPTETPTDPDGPDSGARTQDGLSKGAIAAIVAVFSVIFVVIIVVLIVCMLKRRKPSGGRSRPPPAKTTSAPLKPQPVTDPLYGEPDDRYDNGGGPPPQYTPSNYAEVRPSHAEQNESQMEWDKSVKDENEMWI